MRKKLIGAVVTTAFLALVSIASATTGFHHSGAYAQDAGQAHWRAQAERDWADLPAAAQDVPIPQDTGYLSREVAPGVFVVSEGLYQSMFVVGTRGVVVVDAPPTIGDKLIAAIRAATDKPVTHFVYSHSHIDHVGAAFLFKDAERIASAETAAKLARLRDPNRPIPSRTLSRSSQTLTLAGVRIRFDRHGNHHEPGNLYIHLPRQRVLMVVDVVYPGWVPFTNLGMAEDVQGFIDAHDMILGYDFTAFVGGHLSRSGTRTDVETAKRYVDELIAAASSGKAGVDFYAVAGETGFANRWLLVKTYMDRIADTCSAIMIPKWQDTLAGTHVSTPGHCWIMQEHLNINGMP
jgi:glyoxylase-like metal-dependent hydrolase (beta-lactamase superfamily II)